MSFTLFSIHLQYFDIEIFEIKLLTVQYNFNSIIWIAILSNIAMENIVVALQCKILSQYCKIFHRNITILTFFRNIF